jgi:hypothetical protein
MGAAKGSRKLSCGHATVNIVKSLRLTKKLQGSRDTPRAAPESFRELFL